MLPTAALVNTPVVASIVPAVVGLLLQVPPVAALDSVRVLPKHTDGPPVIAPGKALTVTTAVAAQPVEGIVYEMVAVPAVLPPIRPGASTVAAGSALVHTPPAVALLRVVLLPTHRPSGPVIAAGLVLTVTSAVTKQPDATV